MIEWITNNFYVITLVFAVAIIFLILRRVFLSLRSRTYAMELRRKPVACCRALPERERVEFAVFSPKSIVSNSKFVLDVWAYLPHQYETILILVKEIGREALLGKSMV